MTLVLRSAPSLALACTVLGALLWASPAHAQTDEEIEASITVDTSALDALPKPDATIRVAYIDVTKKKASSKRVAPKIRAAIKELDGFEYATNGEILKALSAAGIEKATLRTGDERVAQKGAIAQAMNKANLDALFLTDMLARGKEIQLIGLGNDGGEAIDQRRKLRKRGRVGAAGAEATVGSAAEAVVEQVRSARAAAIDAEEQRIEAERQRLIAEAKAQRDASLARGRRAQGTSDFDPGGLLTSELALAGGVLLGQRSFSLDRSFATLGHASALVGTSVQLRFARAVGEGKGRVSVDALFDYAPFTTLSPRPDFDGETLSSDFVRGGGTLRYTFALGGKLGLSIFGGGEVISLLIEENSVYTGHRYINALAGAGVYARPIDKLTVELEAGVLPSLSVVSSIDSEEFDGGIPLGIDGSLSAAFALTKSIDLALRYRLSVLNPRHSDADAEDGAVAARDLMHNGGVMARVAF
ncbi:MAG: hypothetical protein AAGI01_00335 [Myxococcota bacterium]